MTTLQEASLARIRISASWQSDGVEHEEHYHAGTINMWRDILPGELRAKLLGCRPGQRHPCPVPHVKYSAAAGLTG